MAEFESRFIDAGGIRTHYLEAGAGAPLILLHGGGAGADAQGNWQGCIRRYAPNFRTIALDMVGFGRSEKPDPARYFYSQPARNAQLAAFIEALGLSSASLIGNSMGGATCLGVAIERPALVDRLVLMGAAGVRMPAAAPSLARAAIRDYDFTPDGMRRMIRALTGPNFVIDEAVVRHRHQLSIEPAARRAYEQIVAWGKAHGGYHYPDEQIASITAPTLVVSGKADQVSPLANSLRYLSLIPNSWGYFIPEVGHWVMIEAAEDFVAATTRFLTAG